MTNQIYTTNIPFETNNPSSDQPIMKQNTNSIPIVLAVDHFAFNDNNGGLHKQSTYVNEAAPTTAAGQLALYSKGPIGGPSELFMIRDGNAGTEVKLTTSAVGNAIRLQTGFSWLPGGMLIQWGKTAVGASQTANINFLQPFAIVVGFDPVVTATGEALSATTTPTEAIAVSFTTNTQFGIHNQAAVARNIYWTAIGPI